MRLRILIILIVFAAVALAAGPAPRHTQSKSKSKSQGAPSNITAKRTYKYPEPSIHCTTVLDEGDTTSLVRLRLGDTLCILLSGTISTGYVWEVISPDTTIINHLGQREVLSPTKLPKGETGYPEKYVWHFLAAREGKTTLSFVYHRSWEKDKPPAKTFQAELMVGGL